MFKSKVSTSDDSGRRTSGGPSLLSPDISPTSHAVRHGHRAKLYSPYTTPRHASKSPTATSPASSSHIRPPSRLRPLADMNSFLGAVFNADGTIASEIPRSALGLPGISTFDSKAAEGGVKIEPMDVDPNNDGTVSFPTSEDVIIGACTCGADCDCPGCSIHGNATGGDHSHEHGVACGAGCKSSFDCTDNVAIPSGVTSVEHLLSLAARHVPPPPRSFTQSLDAHDTRVMPLAASFSPDAALQQGFVQLKPLECCNGRCQCAPGSCSCEKDCCGCCIRCACAEDSGGDSKMHDAGGHDQQENAGNAHANTNGQASSGCCSGGGPTTTTIPTGHARNPSLSVTAPEENDCCASSSASGSGHSPNPSLSFSSADEQFGTSPVLSGGNGNGRHSPRPSLSITTAPDGSPIVPPFTLDSAGSGKNTLSVHSQPTPPLLSPESARLPGQTASQAIPLLSPESARLPPGSSPSSPLSPHSPRSPRSPRSSKGRRSNQSSRSSTPSKEQREDGEPATKRRASFTLQGSNTASSDEGGSRRATLGGASSPMPALSRSASTGKAASKALALNTQPHHPSQRNATSKANSSSSGHLLPPQAGSSSGGSRNPSPHRRRASSGLPSSPRATTPEPRSPRSPTSHGHSASLGHRPSDFQPPSSISIPTLPQFSSGGGSGGDNGPQPPAINIDSVNDDDEFVPDADLLAYINQLTSSSAGTSDVSSIPTNYNFDFINPFETQSQQQQQQQQQPQQSQSQMQQQQHQQQMMGGMPNMNGLDTSNMDLGLGMNGTISTGDFLSMLNQMNGNQQQQQQQPNGHIPAPMSAGVNLTQSMSGLFLGQQQPQPSPQIVLPDMQYDPQQPSSRDPIQPEYAAFMQQQPQQQQQFPFDQGQGQGQGQGKNMVNPNLIDLSKPLNAEDVERILRALQDQQNGSSNTTNNSNQQQPQQGPVSTSMGIGLPLPSMPMSQQQQQQQHGMRPSMQPPMMLPQHTQPNIPQLSPLEAIQQEHRRQQQHQQQQQQDDLFDKFMLDPSPSAPDMNGQQSGFDFNQMYGGINPAHVHMSMLPQQHQQQQQQQQQGNGQSQGQGQPQGQGQAPHPSAALTWEQLRLWAATHGVQAPPGPIPQ